MLYRGGGLFPYYQFEGLTGFPDLLHFVSSGLHTLGFGGAAEAETVRACRRRLALSVGFSPGRWVTAEQVHSDHIAVVGEREAGRGALDRETRIPATDGLVTAERNLCLMVLSADCVPVLLYDPCRKVVAAVHAGWRGTAARIAPKTVEVMREVFGCRPEDIRAGIGPSIGRCCFEVGPEVAGVFETVCPSAVYPGQRDGKFQVDLWETNRSSLVGAGLDPERIEVAGICSCCHPDGLFSYRRQGREAGRFGAGIMLRP